MILIISLCKEKFHELEFVKPVERLISNKFKTVHYKNLTKKDLENSNKVIICGTSLSDFEYLDNLEKFNWINDFQKPLLGICAGSQIIHLSFGGNLIQDKEIGQVQVDFKNFLGTKKGIYKVYTLHKKSAYSTEFKIYAKSEKSIHATKHKNKEIYTCLFHPEVYNQEIIKNFVRL